MGMIDFVRSKTRVRLMAGEHVHWVHSNARASYIISVCLSAPPWVDRAALVAIQDEARRMTQETGMLHVVDHIVPLSHPYVCGLTVPWNLEVVPWRVNSAKSNYWCPEQGELFP